MGTRHFIPTRIVSGFPAIGKSFIAKKFPTMVRDLESSDYHWEFDIHGDKFVHELWPQNYITDIKILEKSSMYRNVMVSSHEMIRNEMAKAGIRYTNIFPENTPEMKKIILDRCRLRQSPPEFIENLDNNWDFYIDSLANDPGAVAKIHLTPESINTWSTRMLMM